MRIIYVAKHGNHDNSDEDAIGFALERLGHQVVRLGETEARLAGGSLDCGDFLLFHKWDDTAALSACKLPRVSWFFDLVDSDDPLLVARSQFRKEWVARTEPHCLLAFYTDGDWAARDTARRIHLPQGADERLFDLPPPEPVQGLPPVLFAGMINHGQKRLDHINHLKERWGDRFAVLGHGGPRRRLHGRDLQNYLAGVKIVVAPDGPGTDRYWSNRVYLTTALGGLLIHPYSAGLDLEYNDWAVGECKHHLVVYHDRAACDDWIKVLLHSEADRDLMRKRGAERTRERFTYRHRCAELCRRVEERL